MRNVYIVMRELYDEIDGDWKRCTHIERVCSSLEDAVQFIGRTYPCINMAHDIPEDYYWRGGFGKIWIQMETVY